MSQFERWLRKMWRQGNETIFLIPCTRYRVRWVATYSVKRGKTSRRMVIMRRSVSPCYGPDWKEPTLLRTLSAKRKRGI